MGDLDKKWEQEQGDWENARKNLFGSREIGCKKCEIQTTPIKDLSRTSFYHKCPIMNV